MAVFVNEKLEASNQMIQEDLFTEMEDGIKLLILVGTVGNFFIPMNLSEDQRSTAIQKLERIKLAMAYMREGLSIDTGNLNPLDFVRTNARGVLRCLYALFEKDSE
jgi:hypothetical protein